MTEPVLKLRSDKYWEAVHERDALKKALDEQNDKLAEYKRLYGELKPATTQNAENS